MIVHTRVAQVEALKEGHCRAFDVRGEFVGSAKADQLGQVVCYEQLLVIYCEVGRSLCRGCGCAGLCFSLAIGGLLRSK